MRMRVLATVLATSAVVSACGGQADPGAQSALPPQAAQEKPTAVPPPPAPIELDSSPAIEEIRQRGKLIVGLRTDDPAFAERDGAGDYRGFDVEIARMLAGGIGMDPQTGVAFRWLPSTLRLGALSGGNVDVLVGGFDPAAPELVKVGPYAVTGAPGAEAEHFVGLRPGDDAMRDELRRVLDEAVASGAWQRAYDATLGTTGVQARPVPR